jgi:tRNA pseudouridine38-40 synthase
MRNIRLDLEYDGTAYHGWQVQPDVSTIQQELEEVLCQILGERVRVVGAGRTDTGVHALGQVGHFRTESRLEVQALLRGMNSLLPDDIVVKAVQEAPSDFHARKSALMKRYEYWILNDPTPSAFHHRFLWHVRVALDQLEMQRAAQHLVGEHDFASFQASGGEPGRDTTRDLRLLEIREVQGGLIRIAAEGRAFLRGMVRILVGTLVDVGRGRLPEQAVRDILLAKDRRAAGRTAPGKGLFLNWVRYPEALGGCARGLGSPGEGAFLEQNRATQMMHLTNRGRDSSLV